MEILQERQQKLKTLLGKDRDIDTLARNLAKKLILEESRDLAPSVLAEISGVSEERWINTYKDSSSFLIDLLNNPVNEALSELMVLDAEERSFLDKLHHVMKIIYGINYDYPEHMVLFHRIFLEGIYTERITSVMMEMIGLAMNLLKKQAREEQIVERESSMESLLFFLIEQLFQNLQSDLNDICEQYLDCKDRDIYPDEEEYINGYLSPITEQLELALQEE